MTDETTAPSAPAFIPGARARVAIVPLEFPVAFDGREYREIHVKRMTAAEVSAFVEGIKDGAKVRWPIFVDAAGAAIPADVLDNLDDDDSLRLDEVARDFLPRRFRGLSNSDSAPAAGDTTAHI